MKRIVKIILLISLVSLIGILSTKFVIKTLAETQYCASIAECFVNEGSGTEADPYQISTPEQLNAIRYNLSASYKLMNDIDLTYDTGDKNGLFYNEGMGWEAIGSKQDSGFDGIPFIGTFDGNDYSIIGLYSNSTTLSYNGLFGYAENATIKNVKLKNVNVNNEANVGYSCQYSDSGAGGSAYNSSAGALVGTTTNTLVENVSVTGNVNAFESGGIVGCAGYNSLVKNSYNIARVIGENAGGISGYTYGATLENVYNIGEIGRVNGSAGGITKSVSYNGKILNAYNTGIVHGSGIADNTSGYNSVNTISNVYNIGLVTRSNIVEDLYINSVLSNAYGLNIMSNNIKISDENKVTIENYNSYSVEALNNVNLYSGFDFNTVWEINPNTGYNYPKLRGVEHIELEEENSFSGGIGKIYDPYQITTSEQLNKIRNFYGKSFILNNDIDLTNDTGKENGLFYNDGLGWEAIGTSDSPFFGTFYGNDYKIIGIFSNRTENSGLFGYIKNSAITDVIMKDVNVTSTKEEAAGLVAYAYNSYINNILVSGNVKGKSESGGIVGSAGNSDLINLVNLSNVDGSSGDAGGIAGHLSDVSLRNSYNTGRISAGRYTGGLVGHDSYYKNVINDCYNVGQVISSNARSGLAVGYSAGSISNVFSLDYGKKMIGEAGTSATASNVSIKTIDELKDVDTYSNWNNFASNYKIETVNNVTRFPVLTMNNTSYIDEISTIDKINLKVNGKLESTTLDYEIISNGIYSDNIILKSNDESIVTVDENGTITAVSTGNTTLDVYGYDGYKVSVPVEVLELTYTSDKYDLSKDYIYVVEEEFDINEINVTNGAKVYEDYKLTILDDDYIVKEYDIVQVSSEKFDLSNDYIILNQNYTLGDITATNGSVSLVYDMTLSANVFNVYYNGEVIDYFYYSDFKDQTFYNCIIDAYNLKNSDNLPYTTHLTDEQLLTINHLNCNGSDKSDEEKVKSITGINKLKNLEYLDLSNNNIEFLELTQNVKLKTILASNNKLKGVYVKTIPGLETLTLDHNNITSLDITSNTNLKDLSIKDNLLTTLNVKNNVNLKNLDISNVYSGGNENNIPTIDLSQNTLLEQFKANRSGLGVSGLNLSSNVNLLRLYLNNNNFTSLDLTNNKNLLILEVSNNKLKNINIDGLTSLATLDLDGNKLTNLNLNTNTALVNLNVYDNQIKTLDLSKNTNLIRIGLESNKLTNLDISNNSNEIAHLYIHSNEFNEDIVIYKGIKTVIPTNLNNIKLPSNYQISLSNITSDNQNVIIDKNKITINEVGDYSLVGNYTHNIQTTSNNFDVNYNVHVIEATSDKYKINAEEEYIFTGVDTDSETILNNIKVNNAEASIENNKLLIKYEGNTVISLDIINIASNQYKIGTHFIYTGTEIFNINNIVPNGVSFELQSNILNIKYNNQTIYSYDIITVSSDVYEIGSVDYEQYKVKYIFGVGELDINNITVTNAEKVNHGHSLGINHNGEFVDTIQGTFITSDKYDLSKDYIYAGNENFDKSYIYGGIKDVDNNKLQIYFMDSIIKEYPIYNINFGELISFDKKIAVIEETTYEDFVSNITTNGVTYKIYNNEEEITTGNITPGMKLQVYVGENLVDTFEIIDEYLKISDNLNVNETTGMIEDLTIGQTVEDLISNIDTTGNVKVVDQENNEVTDTVGTGYKVLIQLSKETIEYTLVVNGDITGDGEIKMSDVMKAATQMIEENTIIGDCYLKAADVTGDGKIKMSDVMKLANIVLEGGNN